MTVGQIAAQREERRGGARRSPGPARLDGPEERADRLRPRLRPDARPGSGRRRPVPRDERRHPGLGLPPAEGGRHPAEEPDEEHAGDPRGRREPRELRLEAAQRMGEGRLRALRRDGRLPERPLLRPRQGRAPGDGRRSGLAPPPRLLVRSRSASCPDVDGVRVLTGSAKTRPPNAFENLVGGLDPHEGSRVRTEVWTEGKGPRCRGP